MRASGTPTTVDRAVVGVYVILTLISCVMIATTARPVVWERGGAIALLIPLWLLIYLLKRRRWAWIACMTLTCAGIALGGAQRIWEHPDALVFYVLPLALLLSPQMRRYVGGAAGV
jgi:hypothetical protein